MNILLKNARILTLKKNNIFDGDILIKNNKIFKIEKEINTKKNKIDKVIDCEKNILLPGFKNAHTHSGMTFLRSRADDLSLQKWLETIVFPAEEKMKKNDVYHLSKVAFLEYITSGITACFDMYFKHDETKRASNDIGMRTVIIGNPEVNPKYSEKSFKEIKEKIISYNRDNDMVTMVLGFHAEYTTTTEYLKKIFALANEIKSPVYTHCCETKEETENCLKNRGLTPIEYFEKLNLFKYGGGIFHGIYLSDKDIEIMKKRNVFMCSCPASNLKLSSGIANIKKLMDCGINIALGTDGPASNNALDMFREMYLVSVLSKYIEKNPSSISAFDVLRMATVNGAKMMGLNNSFYLEKGALADIIMIDIQQPNMQPINNIIENIIYSGSKLNIKMTMINGKILYYNKKFCFSKKKIDNIYKKAQQITNRLKK